MAAPPPYPEQVDAPDTTTAQQDRRLAPRAAAAVALLGIVLTCFVAVVGALHVKHEVEAAQAGLARTLARALAEKIPKLSRPERDELLRRSAKQSGASIFLVSKDSFLVTAAGADALDRKTLVQMVTVGEGEVPRPGGRAAFSVQASAPPERLSVVALLPPPDVTVETLRLLRALLSIAVLLVATASVVAFALARDVETDVTFITHKVNTIASSGSAEPVPLRSIDEVGLLALEFNQLLSRFRAAENNYEEGLERAETADRARSSFLAAVSHELRSPLNAILGFADVLVTEVDGPLPPDAQEELQQVRESGAHLLELINDILEFSALESGQLKLVRSNTDVVAIASEVVREAAGTVVGKPVRVRINGGHPVFCYADAKRVRQILTNLIANAVKFTQRGEVLVTIERRQSFVVLSIHDTGPGISAAERLVIFEEYKQAGEERRLKRGSGLGLAIAKSLVLMHGGVIQVQSEIGRGSTFEVCLPLARDDSSSRSIA